jgi:hypothetical protein
VIELLLQADRLLTVDMVDRAEAIYRSVAEQDPRNAAATVGLARCALARGEDREAYRLAALAHELDPDDDMARRMTLRMAEVLAYRGEPVERAGSAGSGGSAGRGGSAGSGGPSSRAGSAGSGTSAGSAGSRSVSRSWLDRVRGR